MRADQLNAAFEQSRAQGITGALRSPAPVRKKSLPISYALRCVQKIVETERDTPGYQSALAVGSLQNHLQNRYRRCNDSRRTRRTLETTGNDEFLAETADVRSDGPSDEATEARWEFARVVELVAQKSQAIADFLLILLHILNEHFSQQDYCTGVGINPKAFKAKKHRVLRQVHTWFGLWGSWPDVRSCDLLADAQRDERYVLPPDCHWCESDEGGLELKCEFDAEISNLPLRQVHSRRYRVEVEFTLLAGAGRLAVILPLGDGRNCSFSTNLLPGPLVVGVRHKLELKVDTLNKEVRRIVEECPGKETSHVVGGLTEHWFYPNALGLATSRASYRIHRLRLKEE